MLSDQGSNVDGTTIKEICDILGIEKRRSSAYHSQGNGFAERNISSVKDMLRSILLQRKARQFKLRSFLPELVFALNTSLSKAINCVPYNIVFGRSPRLQVDVLLSDNYNQLLDVNTPVDYAQDRRFVLEDTYNTVIDNLQLSKVKTHYNQNLRFHNHQEGYSVWLKVKFYKTGENRKLAPRRSGPWTVIRKLPNGVNFEILNHKTQEKKIVHHDRLTPCKSGIRTGCHADGLDRKQTPMEIVPPSPSSNAGSEDENREDITSSESDIDSSTESESGASDTEMVAPRRQYPQRERRARNFPDNIPWNAIRI